VNQEALLAEEMQRVTLAPLLSKQHPDCYRQKQQQHDEVARRTKCEGTHGRVRSQVAPNPASRANTINAGSRKKAYSSR
jgi:hypothetical protein